MGKGWNLKTILETWSHRLLENICREEEKQRRGKGERRERKKTMWSKSHWPKAALTSRWIYPFIQFHSFTVENSIQTMLMKFHSTRVGARAQALKQVYPLEKNSFWFKTPPFPYQPHSSPPPTPPQPHLIVGRTLSNILLPMKTRFSQLIVGAHSGPRLLFAFTKRTRACILLH